jgi:hypothetical protein
MSIERKRELATIPAMLMGLMALALNLLLPGLITIPC